MDDINLHRMKRARARAAVMNALRAAMPTMNDFTRTKAEGIVETLESRPLMIPTARQCSFAQKFGRFACHCGRVATRVTNLRGRCEDHAEGLTNNARAYQRARDIDRCRLGVRDEPKQTPIRHEGGTRLSVPAGRRVMQS